jgi:gliding motility-associated-like protein
MGYLCGFQLKGTGNLLTGNRIRCSSSSIHAMKKLATALFGICCFLAANAQEQQGNPLLVTPAEYETLKSQGNLNGNFSVIWDAAMRTPQTTLQVTDLPEDYFERGGGGDECSCIQPLDETFSIVPFTNGSPPQYRNDDGFTNEIQLPFTFCLYGQQYNSCFINNNGNISFNDPYSTFSASAFPSTQYVMVAPFWADVDTRNVGSGLVYYRLTPTSLTVYWDRVGYYNSMADKQNTFQVIITNGQDPLVPGGANVQFCYGDMQWTTGSASSGINGFGGVPATVGCNLGDGANFIQLGRFDQPGTNYDGPGGNADQVSWLDNLIFDINACTNAEVDNVPPLFPSLSQCETVYVCQGSDIDLQFLGPEVNQLITLEYEIPGGSGLVFTENSSLGATALNIQATQQSNLGSYPIEVVATDNGVPALSTSVFLTIVVIDDAGEIPILGTAAICSGETTFLSIPAGYTNIAWNTGAAANTISVSQPGTYSVTASLGGCAGAGSVDVTLGETPTPVIVGATQICPGTTTTLSLSQSYPSVVWSTESSDAEITVGPGNYAVEVLSDEGCPGTDAHLISAFPSPQLPADFFECDLEASLNGNDLQGAWSYTTDAEGATLAFNPASQQTTDVTVTASQYGDYVLTFTDAQCGIEENIEIGFYPVPAFVLGDTLVCLGDNVVLAPAGNNAEFFTWSWSTGQDSPFISVVADSLLAEISWSAANNCGTVSDVVNVAAEPCAIRIPNVFTPGNSDGKNDAFVVENLDKYPGSTLRVYNRWGALIFESDSYRNNWSPSADEAPEGTYFYILGWKKAAGMEYFEGHLTLLR